MTPEEEFEIVEKAIISFLNQEKLPSSYPGIPIKETTGYEGLNTLCDYAKG